MADDLTADQIADDFENYAPTTWPVAVESLDPDTGGVLETAAAVLALKRVILAHAVTAGGGGGEVDAEECRFLLLARDMTFVPKDRDRITDHDGLVWRIVEVETIALGAIHRCEATVRQRANV